MPPIEQTALRFDNVEVGDRVRAAREGHAFEVTAVDHDKISVARRVTITNRPEWDCNPDVLIKGDQVTNVASKTTFEVIGLNKEREPIGETTRTITDSKGWSIVARASQIPASEMEPLKVASDQ